MRTTLLPNSMPLAIFPALVPQSYGTDTVLSACWTGPRSDTAFPNAAPYLFDEHTFVSRLSASGVPIEQIADAVGHSSTWTTENVYRRQLRPVLRTAATALGPLSVAHLMSCKTIRN
jgi:hypothetical protein